jgi:hypothetical protein
VPDEEDGVPPDQPVSPASIAVYIAELTEELGKLARANHLEALGYLLDMARLEADQASKDISE